LGVVKIEMTVLYWEESMVEPWDKLKVDKLESKEVVRKENLKAE